MNKTIALLGGATWINLVNTNYALDHQTIDVLDQPSETIQWLEENQLVRESDLLSLKQTDHVHALLGELRSLRELSLLVLNELTLQERISFSLKEQIRKRIEQVNIEVTIQPELENINLVYEGSTMIDHVKYSIIHSMIQSLDSYQANRFRKCEHQDCYLHFIDTSKSGKRRWCSMELCGNRKKAAEFYARKKKNMTSK